MKALRLFAIVKTNWEYTILSAIIEAFSIPPKEIHNIVIETK